MELIRYTANVFDILHNGKTGRHAIVPDKQMSFSKFMNARRHCERSAAIVRP